MNIRLWIPTEIKRCIWRDAIKHPGIKQAIENFYSSRFREDFPNSGDREYRVQELNDDGSFTLRVGEGKNTGRRYVMMRKKELVKAVWEHSADEKTRDGNYKHLADLINAKIFYYLKIKMEQMQRLQNILNECIDRWRVPFGADYYDVIYCFHAGISIGNRKVYDRLGEYDRTKSYHNLFAKESWLMEYIKRKEQWEYIGWCDKIAVHDSCEDFHYMQMSMMTVEEKILYFLEHALLPNENNETNTGNIPQQEASE